MIMPGWRSKGFKPIPSEGVSGIAPAGRNMAATSPEAVCHHLAKGFSKKMVNARKKAKVTDETTITQGRNSRSRSHLRSVTAEAKADISHDQKSSEPACPPHQAVILRYNGILFEVTE